MVKLSEIEKLAAMVGRRSVAQPLTIVSPIRANNGSAAGAAMRPAIEVAITAAPPQITTARYNAFHGWRSPIVSIARLITPAPCYYAGYGPFARGLIRCTPPTATHLSRARHEWRYCTPPSALARFPHTTVWLLAVPPLPQTTVDPFVAPRSALPQTTVLPHTTVLPQTASLPQTTV